MATVGVVGLGLLGHAVASRLLAGGHAVVGYDVLPERVRALTAAGGAAAASAAGVARAAEAVCTVLPSLATVEEAILGPDGVVAGARPGQVVVQMSTISRGLAERLAGALASRGLACLDCPISGTSAMVAAGDGVIFVGGEPGVVERWRRMLETVLPRVVYVGPAGHATVVKLAANLLVGIHSAAAAEALHLVRKAGLDPARALEVLVAGAGSSRMLELRGPMMVRGEFPPQMKLELFMKDLHLIQEAGRSAGAPLPLTDVAERLYAAAHAKGHGGADLSVVLRALEGLAADGA